MQYTHMVHMCHACSVNVEYYGGSLTIPSLARAPPLHSSNTPFSTKITTVWLKTRVIVLSTETPSRAACSIKTHHHSSYIKNALKNAKNAFPVLCICSQYHGTRLYTPYGPWERCGLLWDKLFVCTSKSLELSWEHQDSRQPQMVVSGPHHGNNSTQLPKAGDDHCSKHIIVCCAATIM